MFDYCQQKIATGLRSGTSPEFGFRLPAHLSGGAFSTAQTQVAKILTEKYAAKFDPGFATAVAGNIAKAYESIAPAGN